MFALNCSAEFKGIIVQAVYVIEIMLECSN